jgi:hypothetical protein
MQILNPRNVMEDCLETAFNLKTYFEIMDSVSKPDFVATPEFRKKFNGFYRVRQKSQEWYDQYYHLLEVQKGTNRTFGELLHEMFLINGTVEVSFVSKLMATADPDAPIWNQYVLKNLCQETKWEQLRLQSSETRISAASEIYIEIQKWYGDFMSSSDGKACIKAFNTALPKYKNRLSDVKKIDFMLWSKR